MKIGIPEQIRNESDKRNGLPLTFPGIEKDSAYNHHQQRVVIEKRELDEKINKLQLLP